MHRREFLFRMAQPFEDPLHPFQTELLAEKLAIGEVGGEGIIVTVP